MSADQIDVSCKRCGQALSAFLHEMAEKNAQVVYPNYSESRDDVVCPNCGQSRDDGPEKPERPPAQSGSTSSGSASS